MTCLVLTGVVQIHPHVVRATFTDEATTTTAVAQFDLRGHTSSTGRFAQIVDPVTGTCRPALTAHSHRDVLACIEEDTVDAAALEFIRAGLGGAVPPTSPDPFKATSEATARERLRQALAQTLAAAQRGPA